MSEDKIDLSFCDVKVSNVVEVVHAFIDNRYFKNKHQVVKVGKLAEYTKDRILKLNNGFSKEQSLTAYNRLLECVNDIGVVSGEGIRRMRKVTSIIETEIKKFEPVKED